MAAPYMRPSFAKLFGIAVVDAETGVAKVSNVLELEAGAAQEYGPHVGLHNFCFPEYAKWSPVVKLDKMEAEDYTFTLTGGDGTRTLGFCRRSLPPGSGERYPQVMFLLSAHPWFSIFSSVLKALEPYSFKLPHTDAKLVQASPIADVLRALSKTTLPPPGRVIPAPHVAGGPGLPPLKVPQDRGTGPQNADVYFAPLMWRVPVASLLNLFAALLNERRVVITATDVSALSAAVHAAAAMLYPLQWQHIFLPVLPASLLDYLAAPMPFLVGVPAQLVPAMMKQPMEEVVHLDLDTGKIECFADLNTMPRSQIKRLESELSDALRKSCHDIAIAAALRTFFVDSIGAYRKFIHFPTKPGEPIVDVPKDAIPSGRLWFDHAAFVAASSRSHSTQAFLTTLRHTQCFEAFITSRMDAIGNGGGLLADDAFEKAVAEVPVSDKMSKAADKAAAAGAVAARVAKQKALGAWGSVLRFGESAALTIESAIERAEKSQTAQHIRQRSFDNLPTLGQAKEKEAPGNSPLGRAGGARDSAPGAANGVPGGMEKEAVNSRSVPSLSKNASQDSGLGSDVDIAKKAAEMSESVTIKSSPCTSTRTSLDNGFGGGPASGSQPANSPPRMRPGSEGNPLPPMMRPSKLQSPLLASTSSPPQAALDLLSLDGAVSPAPLPLSPMAATPGSAASPGLGFAPASPAGFAQSSPPLAAASPASHSPPLGLNGSASPAGAAAAAPFAFGGFGAPLAAEAPKPFELPGASVDAARPLANGGAAAAPAASTTGGGEVDFWDTVPSNAVPSAAQWGAFGGANGNAAPWGNGGSAAAAADPLVGVGAGAGAGGADPWGSLGAVPPPAAPVQAAAAPASDLLSW